MEFHLPIQLQKATEMLLRELPKRSQNVLERRFGLKGGKRATLDAIGKTYNITRERVRQIENDSFSKLRKSESYRRLSSVFETFMDHMKAKGGVVAEHSFLKHLTGHDKESEQHAHANFLLSLADPFSRSNEDESLHNRWYADKTVLASVERALEETAKEVATTNRVFTKDEVLAILASKLNGPLEPKPRDVLESYLAISKRIASNQFEEWGSSDSPLINPRGMRDMAFLVLKRHGKPLHFLDTARMIGEVVTKKPVHAQTVHNELIKDNRFVLVGRGTYGLREWGYEPGIVRDVIVKLLKEEPLTKEEIMKRVLGTRQVKENTVLINLQNKNYFKKLPDGRYTSLV